MRQPAPDGYPGPTKGEGHDITAASRAAIEGPYLLVGHSLGGLYARHYATRFPGELAALLLLDPEREEYNADMPAQLREIWEGFDTAEAAAAFDDLPDEVVQLYRGLFAHTAGRLASRGA